jgi:5-bromo-4-chloroindolyl phosphate hydrolysis protein
MPKAKRYTPKESPTFNSTKGTLLYIFLVPLFLSIVLALFQTNIQAFILNGISFFLFLAVATLAKRGFEQEGKYRHATFTKAPKTPYKMIAGYLLGGATFFTAFITAAEPFMKSAFLAVVAAVGYYLFYGFDPKKDKLENLGDISAEFVLETIGEAKGKLSAIKEHMQKIKDAILYEKLTVALQKSDHILQTIEEDPKDIRVARKFLIVYIDGIAKVTNAYTDMDEKDIDTPTKQRLHSLMDEVEEKFDKELERLKNNNQFDLDVHIDTLKEQIKN